MRAIDELDPYELLEVGRDATPVEIDRAYRIAQQTYAEGSLALYSIIGSTDAALIRSRIDAAYGMLVDLETRERYDRERAADASDGNASGAADADTLDRLGPPPSHGPVDAESLDEAQGFDAYDPMEGVDGEFDGVRLRRVRLFRGYELDDISAVTKISGTHLRNIEEENYHDLPADVYVRGFVTAYAKMIGLDPEAVVPSYMSRMQQARREGGRPRLLGRA